MQDLLFNYDASDEQQDQPQTEQRDDYYRKQFKVRFFMKVVIVASLLLSLFFACIRVLTIKKSFTCDLDSHFLLSDKVNPPYIWRHSDLQFFTFTNPSYDISFHGAFVFKVEGGIFSSSYTGPTVTLNDTNFIVTSSFSECESHSFFKEYHICYKVTLSFDENTDYLNKENIELETKPYPVSIKISDPPPAYSMYFSEKSDVSCESTFDILIIPLRNHICYPSITTPLIICNNRTTSENEVIAMELTADSSIQGKENFLPFLSQFIYDTNQTISPTLIRYLDNSISFQANTVSSSVGGKEDTYLITSSRNNTVASVTFNEKAFFEILIKTSVDLNLFAVPFVYDGLFSSKYEPYVSSGLYYSIFNSIDYDDVTLDELANTTTIHINSSMHFYLENPPQIFINGELSVIIDIVNATVLPKKSIF
ncbi:Transmembrane protein [Entamoeba marina]